MVVVRKYELNIDYTKLLGASWTGILRDLLETPYMKNLMYFLNDAYKVYNVRPNRSAIFETFRRTSFADVRVVIIGSEPYTCLLYTSPSPRDS